MGGFTVIKLSFGEIPTNSVIHSRADERPGTNISTAVRCPIDGHTSVLQKGTKAKERGGSLRTVLEKVTRNK